MSEPADRASLELIRKYIEDAQQIIAGHGSASQALQDMEWIRLSRKRP